MHKYNIIATKQKQPTTADENLNSQFPPLRSMFRIVNSIITSIVPLPHVPGLPACSNNVAGCVQCAGAEATTTQLLNPFLSSLQWTKKISKTIITFIVYIVCKYNIHSHWFHFSARVYCIQSKSKRAYFTFMLIIADVIFILDCLSKQLI